MLTVIK